jgi:hypothetical protein
MTAEDRMERAIRWIMVIAVLFVSAMFIIVAMVGNALAQEHKGHPPEHQAIHEKFYMHWHMPTNRNVSCCHDEDCKPAEAYMRGGKWYARHEGDPGEFVLVPPERVDMGLPDSPEPPDMRAHLCGRRYSFNAEFTVFCFIAGNGS